MNLKNIRSKNRKQYRRYRIKKRIRKNLQGTAEKPRLSVFRSNKQIYAQIIDDLNGNTLVSASSRVKELSDKEGNKIEQAQRVGQLIAERAKEAGIEDVVFDRSGYLYHGRVKALAESARKNGLKF
jgi:large subunit ribosomal protein L18